MDFLRHRCLITMGLFNIDVLPESSESTSLSLIGGDESLILLDRVWVGGAK